MATVRHAFDSAKDDPADTSVVGASKWDADHELVDVASQTDLEAAVAAGARRWFFDPRDYGAVSGADAGTPFTLASAAARDAGGGTVYLDPDFDWYFATSGMLPDLSTPDVNAPTQINVLGFGTKIHTDQAIPIISRRNPTSYSPDAIQMTNVQFHFKGLRPEGTSLAGQIGIDLVATFGTTFEDCYARFLDEGFRGTYCLMTIFEDCFGFQNVTRGFHLRSGNGVFTGATLSNSGSNHSVFRSCHDSALAGALSQFEVVASSGVALEDCITEGENPVNAILFDSQYATSVRLFTVRNHHSENTPSGTVARLIVAGASEAVIDGIWHQSGGTIIDASDSGANALITVDMPYWHAAGKLKHGASVFGYNWRFPKGLGSNFGSNFDLLDTALWIGGIVPRYMDVKAVAALAGNAATRWDPTNAVGVVRGQLWAGAPGTGGAGLIDTLGFHVRNAAETQPTIELHRTDGLRLGVGGTTVVDVDLYRVAANALGTHDQFTAADGLVGKYKSGVGVTNLADGDFTVVPANGATGVAHNTTDGKSYYCARANGTWKSVEVTV